MKTQHRFAFPLSALAVATLSSFNALAQSTAALPAGVPVKSLGTVTVNSGRPSSLPTQIPTTIEGISGAQIEQTINAFDAEDALKYLPSLNVRKRPEEIERVGVLYGPYSAAYSGNSAGAVAEYMTRLTTQFEGHVKVGAFSQPYQQFGTNGTFNGSNVSASPTSKASYTPGWWDNTATSNGDTYLRDAAGNKVFSGHVNTGARQYTLAQQ